MTSDLRNNIKSMKGRVAANDLRYKPPTLDSVRILMQRCGWRQSFVAGLLGVNVSTVRRWMSEPNPEGDSRISYGEWLLLLIFANEISIEDINAPISDDVDYTYINLNNNKSKRLSG